MSKDTVTYRSYDDGSPSIPDVDYWHDQYKQAMEALNESNSFEDRLLIKKDLDEEKKLREYIAETLRKRYPKFNALGKFPDELPKDCYWWNGIEHYSIVEKHPTSIKLYITSYVGHGDYDATEIQIDLEKFSKIIQTLESAHCISYLTS